jgi:cob(I)alamin adenosyltransferase
MKIYTKKGDGGYTSLLGNHRVLKSDSRVIAYGKIDTVMAAVGMVLSENNLSKTARDELNNIMKLLFFACAEVATPGDENSQKILHKRLKNSIEKEHIEHLEQLIDDLESKLKPLTNFILPSGKIHFVRCLVREAECLLVELRVREEILMFFNRLSDFLFVLARFENYCLGIDDIILHG